MPRSARVWPALAHHPRPPGSTYRLGARRCPPRSSRASCRRRRRRCSAPAVPCPSVRFRTPLHTADRSSSARTALHSLTPHLAIYHHDPALGKSGDSLDPGPIPSPSGFLSRAPTRRRQREIPLELRDNRAAAGMHDDGTPSPMTKELKCFTGSIKTANFSLISRGIRKEKQRRSVGEASSPAGRRPQWRLRPRGLCSRWPRRSPPSRRASGWSSCRRFVHPASPVNG